MRRFMHLIALAILFIKAYAARQVENLQMKYWVREVYCLSNFYPPSKIGVFHIFHEFIDHKRPENPSYERKVCSELCRMVTPVMFPILNPPIQTGPSSPEPIPSIAVKIIFSGIVMEKSC